MTAYRDEKPTLENRVSKLEAENEALRSRLEDSDVALLEAENRRLKRTIDRHADERVARVFGGMSLLVGLGLLGLGAWMLVTMDGARWRTLACPFVFGITLAIWGATRLFSGAKDQDA